MDIDVLFEAKIDTLETFPIIQAKLKGPIHQYSPILWYYLRTMINFNRYCMVKLRRNILKEKDYKRIINDLSHLISCIRCGSRPRNNGCVQSRELRSRQPSNHPTRIRIDVLRGGILSCGNDHSFTWKYWHVQNTSLMSTIFYPKMTTVQ